MQNASLEAFLYLEGLNGNILLDASHCEWYQSLDYRGRPRSKVRAGVWWLVFTNLSPTYKQHLGALAFSDTAVVNAHATFRRADGQGTARTVWARQACICHFSQHFDSRGTLGLEPSLFTIIGLAAEEMGEQEGAYGTFVLLPAREYAYRPAMAEPVGTSDWMESQPNPWERKKQSGKAYLGSPPLKRSQLQHMRTLAQQQYGVEMKVLKEGDEMLSMMRVLHMRAAFQASTKTVFLQPQATYYEASHELKHAEQCAQLGIEVYAKQTRLDKEMYVYQELMKERRQLTSAEIEHATGYINSERSKAGLQSLTVK